MVSRDGAFGLLICAAVGTLVLVPAHGSAQDSLSVSCADVNLRSPLSDVLSCALREQAFAQHILGRWYDTCDYGLTEDDEEAVRWYRLAAEQGNAGGQSALGSMYARGEGVPEDDEEAAWWYRLAAEQGYAGGQSALGSMYARGEGVPEDDREAVRWYRLAAEQGWVNAQYNLGLMYADGEGVPEDDEEAVGWYRLAAEQGYASAQTNLGLMYVNGEGVPEDLVLAYMWYNLSAGQGDSYARWYKILVEQRMTPDQIAEAQRLSREWIETHSQDGGN